MDTRARTRTRPRPTPKQGRPPAGAREEPIAIIGIGCRFPGPASDPASFWRLLLAGVDAITEVPESRWNIQEFYHPVPGMPGKTDSRWGGFLPEIDQFDPEAFGISPREASYMDPQQRLLLEVAWEALEDGGQVPERLSGTPSGVFVGISTSDYAQIQSSLHDRGPIDAHVATGGALSVAAGRISHCLNLRGPSLAVDTACSSSLVATHLACRALWDRECDLALAGGVNVIISPGTFIGFSAASMLSPEGRCKAFDAGANGFVRGEGAGMVVLKPLSRALADGDLIYAVILASGVNQDGRTTGIAAPSQSAQEALLREVYRRGGLPPHQVRYVEAHGTGTAVGDPIEARALGAVLAEGRPADRACVIGSVKSNIGHLEAAAGMAGLIKVALVLRHRVIPPNLHFHIPNPDISFGALKLRVPTRVEPWPDGSGPAVAGVSSFGFGGTNAHLVLQEHVSAPEPRDTEERRRPARAYVLPLSARVPEALNTLAQRYRDVLGEAAVSLADLCYTASTRRTHFRERLSLTAHTRAELTERLDAVLAGQRPPGTFRHRSGQVPRLVGVFAGQGSQWWGMGRELLATEAVFRQSVEACDAILRRHATWSVLDELTAPESRSRLEETAIAQPAIFVLQVALTALWASWGVRFDAVVGHSVGEIAAAHVAGALGLEEAVRVIYHRGRCMDLASSKGRMLAAGLSEPEAREVIQDYEDAVSLAAVNGPTSVTLSGEPAVLEGIARSLEDRGVFHQFLHVTYAFHSAQMDPVRDELLASLVDLECRPPMVTMASSVTAKPVEGNQLDAHYWWDNVRQRVQFWEAVDWLIGDGHGVFLEISPHPVLLSAIKQALAHRGQSGTVLPSLRRQEGDQAVMAASLGALYTLGYPVDWQGWWSEGGRVARLPTYPWQRRSCWHEPPSLREARLGCRAHPLLGRARGSPDPSWELAVDASVVRSLEDHRVQGKITFPAAAYVEMALGIAREQLGSETSIVEDVRFQKLFFLPERDPFPVIQTVFYPEDASFAVHSRAALGEPSWTVHATGSVRTPPELMPEATVNLTTLRESCPEEVPVEVGYVALAEVGLRFGPSFRGIERLWRGPHAALGRVGLVGGPPGEDSGYVVHPAFLDACFQVLFAAIPPLDDSSGRRAYLPVGIERVRVSGRPPRRVWSHAVLTEASASAVVADIHVYDDDGRLRIAITGFRCQAVDGMSGDRTGATEQWFHEVTWHARPCPERPLGPRAAAYLPGAQAIVEAVTPEVHRLDATLGWSAMAAEARGPLTRLAHAYIGRAFRELGWEVPIGRVLTSDVLMDEWRLAPRHRRLLARLLEILEETGCLGWIDPETWVVQGNLPQEDPEPLWRQTLRHCPGWIAELGFIGRCGGHLAAVLRGEVNPLQCLFPGGSLTEAEHLFQDAPSCGPYNVILQRVVREALRGLPADRTVRVLEVGAGTGGMTTYVLPELPANRTQYVLTDVSPHPLSRGEQKFRDYPFVEFQALDLEADPVRQGLTAHSFDLILALDVLHATRDVREALGHVLRLLSSDGLLVVLEREGMVPWVDLVFGLTEGWWRFADLGLRPRHPMLPRTIWRALLEAAGSPDVGHVALPIADEQPAQVVLIARGPRVTSREADIDPVEVPRPEGGPGGWLLFADQGGVAERVAARLRGRGDTCWLVSAGDDFRQVDAEHFQASAHRLEDMQELLQAVTASAGVVWRGAIHCWSLDAPPADTTTVASLRQSEVLGCQAVMHFVQALYGLDGPPAAPRLVLVTRGAQPVGPTPVAVGQAPLVGLGRTLVIEHPDLRCKLVDLAPDPDPDEIALLLAELWTEDPEEEVALRHGSRLVPRVVRAEPPRAAVANTGSTAPGDGAYRLELPASGVLTGLALHTTRRHRPGPGQVEIAVSAAALNFRDVMKALGLYPVEGADARLLGDECAGTIVEVGEGVEELRVGDEVVAIAPGSFASHVTSAAALVLRRPPHLTAREAVTIPVAFLTAWYALRHLAGLRAGERVLVHAATGGLGLAALQIAEHVGAEVLATAGSAEKRELLARLGVRHVMDSRSLAFADQVMEITQGRGVDVVVNSLAGQALTKSLGCLASHGRFLELGKRDLYQNSKVGLWPFRKSIAFFAVDLGQVMADRPGLVQGMLRELDELLDARVLHPLPYRVFPVARLAQAFRHMAQARHVGKLVVSMQEDETVSAVVRSGEPTAFRPDATYLVVGGLGGFGLTLAQWIVERGGRHLVLVGRRGAAAEDARSALHCLRSGGARIEVVAADVTSGEQVAALVGEIRCMLPPLRGVFHAAMTLDDGLLVQLNAERFRRVTAAKVDGTWNLHVHTLQDPLDHFILFSSMTSLVGNPGQANYAAANAFLDAFAAYRRALGLPGTAINWGQLSGVGYVARHPEVARHLETLGFIGLSPQQAMTALDRILRQQPVQVGVIRVDWHRWAQAMSKARRALPQRLSLLVGTNRADPQGDEGSHLREAIAQALPEEREAMVRALVREQVAHVLGASASTLDVDRLLNELGLDSLMALELTNRLERQLGLALPTRVLVQAPTVTKLATAVLEQLGGPVTPIGAEHATLTPADSASPGLVPLRSAGTRPPLFCLHPAGGLASVYQRLVELLPADQPAYGLQSRLLSGAREEHRSVEDMARAYAQLIRRQQPRGPYSLLGFSFGGFLAVATTHVLERAGQRVAFLGLVDCHASWVDPAYPRAPALESMVTGMCGVLDRELGSARPASRRELDEFAQIVLSSAGDRRAEAAVEWLLARHLVPEDVPRTLMREEVAGFLARHEIHLQLLGRFQPVMIEAPVYVWWADDDPPSHRDGEPGWGRYTKGPLTEATLTGTHYAVMYPPHVDLLARQLAAHLPRPPAAVAAS